MFYENPRNPSHLGGLSINSLIRKYIIVFFTFKKGRPPPPALRGAHCSVLPFPEVNACLWSNFANEEAS